MGYHNYCMPLFAACMTFNDLVIKTVYFNIPKPSTVYNGYFNTVKYWKLSLWNWHAENNYNYILLGFIWIYVMKKKIIGFCTSFWRNLAVCLSAPYCLFSSVTSEHVSCCAYSRRATTTCIRWELGTEENRAFL